jgi:hypothetical protein
VGAKCASFSFDVEHKTMTYHTYTPEQAREHAQAKRGELDATMQAGVQALLTELRQGKSERLLACLNFGAKFHRYSPNNQWLILLQCMQRGIEPEYVAGFTTWKRLNYAVKKGEKGIAILAPRPFTVKKTVEGEETDEERHVLSFRIVYVFANTQVEPLKEGMPPFPQFFTPLQGNHEHLFNRLAEVVREDGIVLEERALGGAQGMSLKGRVFLTTGLDSTRKFLVLIHEYAHELLHKGVSLDRTVKECQAEAVSYIVAHHFGVHNPFSSDYLQMWGNDEESLLTELEMVQRTATAIIERMERPFVGEQPNDIAA